MVKIRLYNALTMTDSILPEIYNLPFLKMQGLGNDLIFIDAQKLLQSEARPLLSQWMAVVPRLTRYLCHRRLSIGADGLILAMALDSEELRQMAVSLYGNYARDCHLSWTYHNSDGSQSHMCGNGLRCLALWAKHEKNMSGELKVATQIGPITIHWIDDDNITVTLSTPKLNSKEIPFVAADLKADKIVRHPFTISGLQFPITCVNVGNPHCVIFEGSFLKAELFGAFSKELPITAESIDIGQDFFPRELVSLARNIETDKRFPECTNVEFVQVLDRNHIQLFVWERGSGATLACGSAAVAAFTAGVLEDRLDRQASVTLPGGRLYMEWLANDNIKMTGGANLSFRGQIQVKGSQLKTAKENKDKVPNTSVTATKVRVL